MTPREKQIAAILLVLSILSPLAAYFFPLASPALDAARIAAETEASRVPRCGLDAGLERCTSISGPAYELNDSRAGSPCTCPER